jgi:polygalacturonase
MECTITYKFLKAGLFLRAGLPLFCLTVALNASGMTGSTSPMAEGNTASGNGTYNVRDYGAVGDGRHLDSKAINKAIETAAAAGGGTVYLPSGDYLSGSIHLKSNIALFIDQGATIIADSVSAENGYDSGEAGVNTLYQDAGHSHFHNSLIWGEDLHDVSIIGTGMIWGKGLYRDYVKGGQTANKAIALFRCRNVLIRDITILQGGWFGILATGVDHLTLDNLKIDTNRDGMDIDCCRNVHVSDCSVNSPFDDGICLKSSFALGYARPTENVTITNCLVSGYDMGSFLDGTYTRNEKKGAGSAHPTGRIKMGTESNGGFKNITISNCVFEYCRGLALETVDGGLLEDVAITNITMRDISGAPIFLRLGGRMRGPDGTPVGALRRVLISNVVAYNVDPSQGILISGIPGHDIEDVELRDIKLYFMGGGTEEQAKREVPALEKGYPEPSSFGTTPAYGLYIRNVNGIILEDIQLNHLTDDRRPAVYMDSVSNAALRFIGAPKADGVSPLVVNNGTDIRLFKSLGLPDQP